MIDWVTLPLTLLLGFGLGLGYFSFLWVTVQRLPRTRHPILLMVGSGLARLGIALIVLYLLAWDYWPRLVAALLGFLLARTLLIARWRPHPLDQPSLPGGWDGN
ncbi:MAG: ATP synthase subunit I [Synechocystis sp.]